MADLIEREAALAKIDVLRKGYMIHEPAGMGGMSAICYCRDIVKDIPAVNRWISVQDALLEKDKSYITYAETTKYCTHNEIPEELRINILYFNGEEWYDEECRYYNVTHYMPLPEPPESEVQE